MIPEKKPEHENNGKKNHLINEKSPYLQQHVHNPVDWYPWGEEAFKKSKSENKPIFLSIGYSTCHWCHVMAHESFEDPEVGKLINEVFIPIKVDREERPEIDNIYMNVCQMMTGGGGWPLTIILTPERKPFFAGTYFPKESQYGRPGLKDIIIKVKELWDKNPHEALQSAEKVVDVLKQISQNIPGSLNNQEILEETYSALEESFDPEYGGFGMIQKFPSPSNLYFLLRYWKRTSSENCLDMVTLTLDKMRYGGIYDHVGFGFHRYAVDPQWLVPHFEKMLYDQALISMAYLEAFQITKKPLYQKTAEEIFEYVIRDMQAPEGGFYSAEDADSEGEEGKFYLWTKNELEEILGDDASLIRELFNISPEGNFEEESTGEKNGKNIFHLNESLDKFSVKKGMNMEYLEEKVDESLVKLFNIRKNRIHPQKDDKILTDWNGLIIAALSRGYQILGDERYSKSAKKAADFILSEMYDQKRLMHRYKDGESGIFGNLDDYAFLIWGLLELYQATFEVKYLNAAFELNESLNTYFLDEKSGGYYFTADDAEKIILRKKESYDSAIPSGNSVQMLNLLKMAKISEDESLIEIAQKIESYFSYKIKRSPLAHTNMINAIDFRFGPSYDIIISCPLDKGSSRAISQLRNILSKNYIPNLICLDITPKGGDIFEDKEQIIKLPFSISESFKAKKPIENLCTYYICSDTDCKAPLTKIEDIMGFLKS